VSTELLGGGEDLENRSHFTRALRALDGKPYPSYRELMGSYELGPYQLFVDHVQADPLAPPTRIRLRVHADELRLPGDVIHDVDRRVAAVDFLTRKLTFALESLGRQRRGSGRGGVILIDTPGQCVLARSSVSLTDTFVEARIAVGLPADGRRIRAKDAEAMFLEDIPFLLHVAWSRSQFPFAAFAEHLDLYCDQCALRNYLSEQGLIAFVGDGAILARKSGISELPMDSSVAEPFVSPASLRHKMQVY